MTKIYQLLLGAIGMHGAYYAYDEDKTNPTGAEYSKRIFSKFCYGVTRGIENTIIVPANYVNSQIIEFKNKL